MKKLSGSGVNPNPVAEAPMRVAARQLNCNKWAVCSLVRSRTAAFASLFRSLSVLLLFIPVLVPGNCNNMVPDTAQTLKAYPTPYNPTAGVLTIEYTDGSAFSTSQNDFIVYDFALNEVYRANLLPVVGSSDKKLVWAGIDNAGIRVSPGIYYLKVIATTNAGAANTDSMFRLIVQ